MHDAETQLNRIRASKVRIVQFFFWNFDRKMDERKQLRPLLDDRKLIRMRFFQTVGIDAVNRITANIFDDTFHCAHFGLSKESFYFGESFLKFLEFFDFGRKLLTALSQQVSLILDGTGLEILSLRQRKTETAVHSNICQIQQILFVVIFVVISGIHDGFQNTHMRVMPNHFRR